MKDVEARLKQLGEVADATLPPHVSPRPEALKRIRMRRRALSGGLVLCSVLVATVGVVLAGSGPEPRPVRPAHEDPVVVPPDETARPSRCFLGFEPTYVPPGFEAKPVRVAGEEGAVPPGYPAATFRGPRGSTIEVTFPEDEGFAETRRRIIAVLDDKAVLGDIHEGFAVDFEVGRCRVELLGYGIERSQLRLFAMGLVSTGPIGPRFGAVWPEDTASEARRGCAGNRTRTDPTTVAERFAQEILRWEATETSTFVSTRTETVEVEVGYDGYDATPDERTGRGVRLSMREVLPDCWSVIAASPLPERRLSTLSVGVNGSFANVVFERHGVTSATIEFGYGSTMSTVHWQRGEPHPVTVPVGGRTDTTGHFLVILRDADGDPFTAIGRPLPPGDFAAG